VLRPGECFETVPVAVTVAADFTAAVGRLDGVPPRGAPGPSRQRDPRVVFNDYMNTLNGDPTTEAGAAHRRGRRVGCEIFCIDAAGTTKTGSWWDSVGEWLPSRTRFPGGLG